MRAPVPAALLLLAANPAYGQFPPQIRNIVVIIQENRTPDNLFHYLAPACSIPADATGLDTCTPSPVANDCYDVAPCGVSNRSGTPRQVTLKPAPLAGSATPLHSHFSFEKMCDPDPSTQRCRDDGAWKTTTPQGAAYAYVENAAVTNYDGSAGHLLDPYLTFAKQYGWANAMFQSNQGPSYPAHQFLFAGTSALTEEDDARSAFVAEDFNTTNASGCLAPKNATNNIVSPVDGSPDHGCELFNGGSVKECPASNTALKYPANPVGSFCYSHATMADLLDAHSVSWKYYAATAGSLATAPVASKTVCEPAFATPSGDPKSALKCTGGEWNAKVDIKNNGTDILRDIADCSLARVSWVTPDDKWSDHAGGNDYYGPSWVTAIINAIGTHATCPSGTKDAGENYWQETAILVTWDDWGGWTDHVVPPLASALPCHSDDCQGDYQYGFRVPLLVISAYTPAGTISNSQYDFATIIRTIEGVNHLSEGQLGFADQRATDSLREFFTLQSPRSYQAVPAQKDANFFLRVKSVSIEPDDD